MPSVMIILLLCPQSALAGPSLGSTWSMGSEVVFDSWYRSPFDMPTISLRWDRLQVSASALDTLGAVVAQSGFEASVDASYRWHQAPVADGMSIVDRPGLRVSSASNYVNLLVGYRAGLQVQGQNGAGFSLCVAPALGPSYQAGGTDRRWRAAVASGVELSVWGPRRSSRAALE